MTKIKANAANKAASVDVNKAANEAIRKLAEQYRDRASAQIGKLQAEFALKARDIVAENPEANVDPLVRAFGKQRASDARAIIAASEEDLTAAYGWFAKNRKPGLQLLCRGLKLAQFGKVVDEAAAREYIRSGKKAEFLKATGQSAPETGPEAGPEAAPKKASEPKSGRKAGDTHEADKPAPAPETVGNLSRLNDLLPALEAEMAEYGPEVKKAMKAFKAAASALIKAAANG